MGMVLLDHQWLTRRVAYLMRIPVLKSHFSHRSIMGLCYHTTLGRQGARRQVSVRVNRRQAVAQLNRGYLI